MGHGRGVGRGRAIDQRGIGRPPAHVAGPFIEVAVDQLDGVEREVDHALAARALAHAVDRGDEVAGALGQLAFEFAGDSLDLLADAADLLRHHREARALRAGARAFDQRVQRQHLHLVGDLLDRLGLVDRDLVDLRREAVDQRGDIGIIISGFICDRLGFETQRSRHRGLPLAMRSDLQRTRNNH